MVRTDSSFYRLLLFQRIEIRCYNISRGYATDLFKRIILVIIKHNPVPARLQGLKKSFNSSLLFKAELCNSTRVACTPHANHDAIVKR
jgi:hypothetical protein